MPVAQLHYTHDDCRVSGRPGFQLGQLFSSGTTCENVRGDASVMVAAKRDDPMRESVVPCYTFGNWKLSMGLYTLIAIRNDRKVEATARITRLAFFPRDGGGGSGSGRPPARCARRRSERPMS